MSQESTNYAVSFTMREGGMGAEERLAAVQEFLRKWVVERDAERGAAAKVASLVPDEKFTQVSMVHVTGASLTTDVNTTRSTISWMMTYRYDVFASAGLVSEPSVGPQLALKLESGDKWNEPISRILRACYANVIFEKMTIKSFDDLQFLKRRAASLWVDRWAATRCQESESEFVRRKIYASAGWKPKDVPVQIDQ